MRSIDVHAHLAPRSFWHAVDAGKEWHGIRLERDEHGWEWPTAGPHRHRLHPKDRWTPEQRLVEMSSLGVDIQVLSLIPGSYSYHLDSKLTVGMARDCNDEISQMTKSWPEHFAGFCTLPMQDVRAAVKELERGMMQLGLKGAIIGDHVNGRTLDEPEFGPFWQAAEEMKALIFIHQGGSTVVDQRTSRYHLSNTVGNLAERSITFASLVFGGVMDRFPDLNICLAHGGGYVCYGIGRMDRGWQVRPEARVNINRPPSSYVRRFFYDCLTHSEAALRMLIDTVGADRVVFGTDWPADMAIDWPVSWVLGLESLTQEEKELILWRNLEGLLGI